MPSILVTPISANIPCVLTFFLLPTWETTKMLIVKCCLIVYSPLCMFAMLTYYYNI